MAVSVPHQLSSQSKAGKNVRFPVQHLTNYSVAALAETLHQRPKFPELKELIFLWDIKTKTVSEKKVISHVMMELVRRQRWLIYRQWWWDSHVRLAVWEDCYEEVTCEQKPWLSTGLSLERGRIFQIEGTAGRKASRQKLTWLCFHTVSGGSICFQHQGSHCCMASGLILALLSWPQSCSPCLAFFLKEMLNRIHAGSTLCCGDSICVSPFSPQRDFYKTCMQTDIFVCFSWVAFA